MNITELYFFCYITHYIACFVCFSTSTSIATYQPADFFLITVQCIFYIKNEQFSYNTITKTLINKLRNIINIKFNRVNIKIAMLYFYCRHKAPVFFDSIILLLNCNFYMLTPLNFFIYLFIYLQRLCPLSDYNI